ncbi:SDR family oxidoreductase [Kitasatospora herbaricolor]|uniref:SDR family oxidoreductase n=1 Tax=Kitasatospora herbaricolor TaxID=68217 RepID=A0ABZ1W457_9ACTN|nr:SDR family oxidoreductase [Kitasatospora herbaricolor]
MSDTPVCRRLVGRTAVVTGAGGDVGLAAARRLAAEGAKVVCADLDERAGAAAAREVGGLFVHTDVTDPAMVEALFDEAYETFGGIDVAFHHAGGGPPGDDSVLTTDLDAWHREQQAGLTSVFLCCRAVLPYMRRHGRGSVINIVGPGADPGAGDRSVAAVAAEGGVLAMSRELGVRFAREGIRVNVLRTGPVGASRLPERSAGVQARRAPDVPLGRSAAPEEIAAAVAFLASDDSSFVTASEFLVDGGLSWAGGTPLRPPGSS